LYQRADDNPETVRKRIDVYTKETSPLIDYYKKAKKLVEIKGEGNIDNITKDIIASLPKS
jgi:adenylate kinase